jgi:hypothetical protein
MIVECFCYFNEKDLLEQRIRKYSQYIDMFIICESSVTHVGNYKGFTLDEKIIHLSELIDSKIIYLKVPDPFDPSFTNSICKLNPGLDKNALLRTTNKLWESISELKLDHKYSRDYFQKGIIEAALAKYDPNTLVLYSDIDEFYFPHKLKFAEDLLNDGVEKVAFRQPTHYYKLGFCHDHNWLGTRASKLKTILKLGINLLRIPSKKEMVLENAGVHISFFFGVKDVKKKIINYSAQEFGTKFSLALVSINYNLGLDPFFRSYVRLVPSEDYRSLLNDTVALAKLNMFQKILRFPFYLLSKLINKLVWFKW